MRARLDSRWCPLPLQVGPAHPSPENQFGVSHSRSESRQRLPGRPSRAGQGHVNLAPLVGPGAEVGPPPEQEHRHLHARALVWTAPRIRPLTRVLPVPRACMYKAQCALHSGSLPASPAWERLPSHVGMRGRTCAASSPGACSMCPFQLGVVVLPHERLTPQPQVSSWAGLVTFRDLPVA